MRRRPASAGTAAVVVLLALTGCSSLRQPQPFPSRADPISYTAGRSRYLAAMCPLEPEAAFWSPVDWADPAAARRTARRLVPIAERALERLDVPATPYPVLLRGPMAELAAAVARNTAYFAAVRAASGPAAVEPVQQPIALPGDALAEIERAVLVSAAPGSDNCAGRSGASSAPPTGSTG